MVAAVAVSCSKFLEKQPDSTIASVTSPRDVSQLLTSAYAKASYINFAESMSDNVEDGRFISNSDKTNEQSYLFQVVQGSPDMEDSPEMYWVESYKAIATCNQALKVCNSAPAGDSSYNAQKGEAYVARAYAHFMLVCFFSKFYDPATAASSPGIPYVTEPEDVVIKQYERKTVAYVYEMVEKDLLAGLPLIRDAAYTVPGYHFNLAAANAFAARFYLFKREYAKALQYATAAIPGNNMASKLRPWNTIYYAYTPAQLRSIYTTTADPANLLLVEAHSVYGRYVGDYRYGKTNNKVAALDTIKRIASTSATWPFPSYFYGNDSYFVPKYKEYFVVTSTAANIGNPFIMAPLFTAEEVLFIRAEANARLDNSAAALADLNLYASTRFRNYNASTMTITQAKINARYGTQVSDKENLINAVLNMKRMEFVQDGLRYFDLQRTGTTITHVHQPDFSKLVYDTIVVPASDNRRVLQLPQTVVLSGVELNPR